MSGWVGLMVGSVIVIAVNFAAGWWRSRPNPEAKRAAERWAELTKKDAQ